MIHELMWLRISQVLDMCVGLSFFEGWNFVCSFSSDMYVYFFMLLKCGRLRTIYLSIYLSVCNVYFKTWKYTTCIFILQKEKKILETKRLDLDASKNRLRKAKSSSQPQVDWLDICTDTTQTCQNALSRFNISRLSLIID